MDYLLRYIDLRDFVKSSYSQTTCEAVDKALIFAGERMGG